MARIVIEEVCGGEKYDAMSAVMADPLSNGHHLLFTMEC